MAHAVARNGYRATSVAEVIGLAGVSRTTFYKHFANKQDCFMATYEMLIYRMTKNIRRAHQNAGDWDRGLNAAFRALTREVVGDPNGSRIVIVGVPDAKARPAHLERRAGAVWERTLRQSLCSSPRGTDVSGVLITGILGGIREVIARRLLEDHSELPATCEGLLDWVLSYHAPIVDHTAPSQPSAAKDPRTMRCGTARRGNLEAGAPRTQTPVSRARSTPRAAGEHKGQGESQPAGLPRRAPQSTKPSGGSKAACPAIATDWSDAISESLGALIEFIAAHPSFGRLKFAEVWNETNVNTTRAREPLGDFAALLGEGYELSQSPPSPIASEAVIAAIWTSIRNETLAGRIQGLDGLQGELTDLALTPFIRPSHEAALSEHSRQGVLDGALAGGSPPALHSPFQARSSADCYRQAG
jgi:AcrR family transcriptional regulator